MWFEWLKGQGFSLIFSVPLLKVRFPQMIKNLYKFMCLQEISEILQKFLGKLVHRSHNKIVEPKLLPKREQKNLFVYPDNPEILET